MCTWSVEQMGCINKPISKAHAAQSHLVGAGHQTTILYQVLKSQSLMNPFVSPLRQSRMPLLNLTSSPLQLLRGLSTRAHLGQDQI